MAEIDLAAERQFWIDRGMAPETFDAYVNGQGSPTSPPTPPAPAAAEQLVGFMPANVAEAARAAVAAGHWTPEQARRELEGYDPEAIDAALAGPVLEKNEDLATLNRGGFVGAQSAAEIGPVSYDPITISHLSPAEFMRLDSDLKGAAIDMGVPASGAAPLIKTIADAAARYQRMSEAERTAFIAQEKTRMISALGADRAKETHAKAASVFAKIKNTALAENLVRAGALHDGMVVWTLAATADVTAVREAVAGGQALASISNALRGA